MQPLQRVYNDIMQRADMLLAVAHDGVRALWALVEETRLNTEAIERNAAHADHAYDTYNAMTTALEKLIVIQQTNVQQAQQVNNNIDVSGLADMLKESMSQADFPVSGKPETPVLKGLTKRQMEALQWLRKHPDATAEDMREAIGTGMRMYYKVKPYVNQENE